MKHASDSSEQRKAEEIIVQRLSREIGIKLEPKILQLANDTNVQLDGYSKEEKILCEVYAHIGKLKGAQPDKVASDMLKMLLIEKTEGGIWQKYLCFASGEASSKFIDKSKSWLAYAVKEFNIKIFIFELDPDIRKGIIDAQGRQKMVNISPMNTLDVNKVKTKQ